MRHLKKGFKLGRTASHRKATLAALSNALIAHKRITTTLSKAKALRTFVEPIISRSKDDTTHNRRQVFRRLQSKDSVKMLFDEIAAKIEDRAGGYTRVIRLGKRPGDGAEIAVIELVDYNNVRPTGAADAAKVRRTRRAGRRRAVAGAPAAVAAPSKAVPEAVVESPSAAEAGVEPEAESSEAESLATSADSAEAGEEGADAPTTNADEPEKQG